MLDKKVPYNHIKKMNRFQDKVFTMHKFFIEQNAYMQKLFGAFQNRCIS